MDCALCQVFPKKLVYFSTWIDHTRWARNSWAIAAVVILTLADVMDMVRLSLLELTTSVFGLVIHCNLVFVHKVEIL